MTGERIGDYTVERRLGSGGMGAVYLGRSPSGRAVAIKVVRPEYAADPEFRARFRTEVEAARRVGGFHTAAVVDADPDAERPWMASAYIKGPTLSEAVARHGPMDDRPCGRSGPDSPRRSRRSTPADWSTGTSSPGTSC